MATKSDFQCLLRKIKHLNCVSTSKKLSSRSTRSSLRRWPLTKATILATIRAERKAHEETAIIETECIMGKPTKMAKGPDQIKD